MDIATRILILGGMSVHLFDLLLGIPMVVARRRIFRAPRSLVAAHLASIILGGRLLALTVAVGFSTLRAMAGTTAVLSNAGLHGRVGAAH